MAELLQWNTPRLAKEAIETQKWPTPSNTKSSDRCTELPHELRYVVGRIFGLSKSQKPGEYGIVSHDEQFNHDNVKRAFSDFVYTYD